MAATDMKVLQMAKTVVDPTPKLALGFRSIPQLKPGQALIRVTYASIQPSDRLNAQGLFPSTTYPRIPGRDYSGIVLDVADKSDASKSWIGKSVYGTSGSTLGFDTDGAHAQYCLVPQDALVEKPSKMSFLQAATVGVPFTTAYICISKAQVTKSDVVLILGANGAVGSAASQMSRAIGCEQVLTATRRPDCDSNIVISQHSPQATLTEQVTALTEGKGVDVVIDTVGDLDLMTAALEQLTMKGRYAWIAAPRGEASKKIAFDIFQAYRKEITMLGCNSAARSIEETAGYLRIVNSWIAQGSLQTQSEQDFETVRLDEAIEHGYSKAGHKVVIDMS